MLSTSPKGLTISNAWVQKDYASEPSGSWMVVMDESNDTQRAKSMSNKPVRMQVWIVKFLRILKRYGSDTTIAKILIDASLAYECGVLMRFYTDKKISGHFNAQRKARGRGYRKTLERAQSGLTEAVKIFQFQQRADLALSANHLSAELAVFERLTTKAFDAKKHGRDRDHGLLGYGKRVLELRLGSRVPYSSLATLVTAAERTQAEVEGLEPPAPVDENVVRKRLAHLRDKAPQWTKALLELKQPTKPL